MSAPTPPDGYALVDNGMTVSERLRAGTGPLLAHVDGDWREVRPSLFAGSGRSSKRSPAVFNRRTVVVTWEREPGNRLTIEHRKVSVDRLAMPGTAAVAPPAEPERPAPATALDVARIRMHRAARLVAMRQQQVDQAQALLDEAHAALTAAQAAVDEHEQQQP